MKIVLKILIVTGVRLLALAGIVWLIIWLSHSCIANKTFMFLNRNPDVDISGRTINEADTIKNDTL